MEAVEKTKEFVMAGSMNSFHEYFDPMFLLAIYLTADPNVRVKRIHEREQKEFGDRILPGGDMYEEHQQFLNDAANYDGNAVSCNKSQHELWMNQIGCPVLELDGEDSVEENAKVIIETYRKLSSEGKSDEDQNCK